jgi:hypothetical protein
VEAEHGTGVAAAPQTAKDMAVQWAHSETGVPKRVRRMAQVDVGQNSVASATLPHSCGQSGVEQVQAVAARNGCGSTQEEAVVAESTRGGMGAGRGYSIEGGMAWRGRVCSGWCGGGAMVTWQVRRGNAGVERACMAP